MALTEATPIRFDGVGPVRIGMTYAEAAQAAAAPLTVTDAFETNGACVDVTLPDSNGITFMGSDGKLVRLDIHRSAAKTEAGVGIGSSEAEVRNAYGDALTISAHPYGTGGHYLTVAPSDPALGNLRMIFETDGIRVTNYRTGLEPYVDYIEGCA